MIEKLKSLDFRVTMWIHPFVSCRSRKFIEFYRRGFLIQVDLVSTLIDFLLQYLPRCEMIIDELKNNALFQIIKKRFCFPLPGITLWWNGLGGVLDFSNPAVRSNFLKQLDEIKKKFLIDSFKFDAGEVVWLPIGFRLANPDCQSISFRSDENLTTPALYPHLYSKLAAESDQSIRLQEVRVAYRTQNLPMFVRVIDKDSNWSYENGLKSLLPSIFNVSLLGYPFVLPDMVRKEKNYKTKLSIVFYEI